MISILKFGMVVASVAAGTVLCPLCQAGVVPDETRSGWQTEQVNDTATVRLHISGMTCSTCPTTARVTMMKMPGVVSVIVTLDDSLGVVRYDPARVTPAQITEHLAKLTDYRATVLADSVRTHRKQRGT